MSLNMWMRNLWTELNQETNVNLKYFILEAFSVNMWWSYYLCFSVWIHPLVNRFQSRNTWNSWTLNSLNDICQYVVVLISAYQCVGLYACEQNSIKKQLELLRIKSSKWCLSICGSLCNCVPLCGHGFLEPLSIKLSYIHYNMWWSDCLSFRVWRLPPVKRFQSRNNKTCCAFNSSSDCCQYVVVWIYVCQCVDASACEHILIKKQLEQLIT